MTPCVLYPDLWRIWEILLMRTGFYCLTSVSLASRDDRTVYSGLLWWLCWTRLSVNILWIWSSTQLSRDSGVLQIQTGLLLLPTRACRVSSMVSGSSSVCCGQEEHSGQSFTGFSTSVLMPGQKRASLAISPHLALPLRNWYTNITNIMEASHGKSVMPLWMSSIQQKCSSKKNAKTIVHR